MIMFVCPRCSKFLMSIHGLTEKCECCGTQMIETKYDEQKVDMSLEELQKLIFSEYVKNNPLYDPDEEKRTTEHLKQRNSTSYNNSPKTNIPRCPICQSTNLEKISTAKKIGKIAMFGVFGMGDNGKTWRCKNCGSKF